MTEIDDKELLMQFREDGDENVLLLDPLTAFRLAEAFRTDEHMREVLVITSAVRPREEQAELYKAYKEGRGVLAANPDRELAGGWRGSYHMQQANLDGTAGYGYAVDVSHKWRSTWSRIHRTLRGVGLYANIAEEPWHHVAQSPSVNGAKPLPGIYPDWWKGSREEPEDFNDPVDDVAIDWGAVLKRIEEQGKLVSEKPIKKGIRGDAVTTLQTRLKALGLDPGPIDGIDGSKTETAVARFQDKRGLLVDGVCGRMTWDELWKADEK